MWEAPLEYVDVFYIVQVYGHFKVRENTVWHIVWNQHFYLQEQAVTSDQFQTCSRDKSEHTACEHSLARHCVWHLYFEGTWLALHAWGLKKVKELA